MPDRPRNIGASVRQRLLNLAHARGQPMELLLTRYALERLLHRLSLSPHRERFVLKGAMLLVTWFDEPHRATRDVDLLGFGDAAEGALLGTFREIMAVEVDDGVSFDLKGLRNEAIREDVEYGGSRLRTTAASAGARIPITVDIGFGGLVDSFSIWASGGFSPGNFRAEAYLGPSLLLGDVEAPAAESYAELELGGLVFDRVQLSFSGHNLAVYDDLSFNRVPERVPEPGVLVLLGLGLAFLRHRKSGRGH